MSAAVTASAGAPVGGGAAAGAAAAVGSVAQTFPNLAAAAAAVPKPEGVVFSYGTAGFRTKGELLDSTCFRMGVLCALRSYATQRVIGICMTASHNPEEDNGIKISDPDGGVLSMSWEQHCTDLANAPDDGVVDAVQAIVDAENISLTGTALVPSVFVACDTRKTGQTLCNHARDAALALKANVLDFGQLTTPQLHYSVRTFNLGGGKESPFTEAGYIATYAAAFKAIAGEAIEASGPRELILDGANGVGALKVPMLTEALGDLLKIDLRNTGQAKGDVLNFECGADFVYRGQTPPKGVDAEADKGKSIASFDGDADRVVYHYFDEDGGWNLLDGDKLTCLYADFLRKEITELGLEDIKFGVVQTPYANGGSTIFMKEQGMEVRTAKTGVKYVHHVAIQYDIGVYFEANGHGTVVFSDKLVGRLREFKGTSDRQKLAAHRILQSYALINQGVGDAISDFLFVEAILATSGMSVQEWAAMYENVPSCQLAVRVPDRTAVSTTEDECRCTAPEGLQEGIDAAVEKYDLGRSFVRPSGTEDVVRVYAEAGSKEHADALAAEVQGLVQQFCK